MRFFVFLVLRLRRQELNVILGFSGLGRVECR
jgi:hypothetical protein